MWQMDFPEVIKYLEIDYLKLRWWVYKITVVFLRENPEERSAKGGGMMEPCVAVMHFKYK